MKSQEEIDYENRVKRRVLILKELLEQGKIHVDEGMRGQLEESLKKAQYNENGEPDLSTIDSRIRSMAMAAEHFDYIDKTKNLISLFDIQRLYFERIDGNFNFFYEQMLKFKTNPHELASSVAYGKSDINHLNDVIEPILKDLQDFWETVAESGYLHLDDYRDSIKGVFGGDLFPAHNENIASKCGIYTDTIILPCPFIRCREFFPRWSKEQRVYFLIKHALNVLQYRELSLADVSKPIVVILPDKEMMDEFAFEQIKKLGEEDSLHHASKIFGRNFETVQELFDFAEKLDTIEKVIKEIKDENRILFDIDFKEPLKVQIQNQMSSQANQMLGTVNPGLIVAAMALGRMSVCNEILIKSAKVKGIPLIDAPTSWEYFKWKLEYDTERTFPTEDFSKLHIVKGLEGLSNTNLKWIGRIPTKGLIELRKTGAIDEIRQILSKGIDEIVLSNELDFSKTSNKVLENLDFAFKQHEKSINVLTAKKWKVAGKDFGSWIVMGSVEIASACIGTPVYGLSTVVLNQILDAPKIKDLPQTFDKMKEIDNEKTDIKRSPLGLIFKYK